MHRQAVIFTVASIVLAACAPLDLKDVRQQEIVVPDATNAARVPVGLETVMVKVRRGTPIGRFHVGVLCGPPYGDVAWETGRITKRDLGFADLFFDSMTEAGFDVVGDPDTIFNQRAEMQRAEFKVASIITDIKINICNKMIFKVPLGEDADAYMKIDWQVYSNRARRVVYSATTEGRGQSGPNQPDGSVVALDNAFASAAGNFAADPKLREFLTRELADVAKAAEDPVRESKDTVVLRRLDLYGSDITRHIQRLRASTVTVLTDGGHGSGYFVSEDGLVVTNSHVVGDARFVTIRLVNGREVVGEVLRRNKRRDVALVLVEGRGYVPIPVREVPVKITEVVYAIGTPELEELAQTVSKGVVSAFRREGNRPDGPLLIQADVTIHGGNSGGPLVDASGNLVGMTVAGYIDANGADLAGLSLFIPIMEAMAGLDIQIEDRPVDYRAAKVLTRTP